MTAILVQPPEIRLSIWRRVDIPFVVMGLFFVAMALAEYYLPAGAGGDRMAIKILSGAQIAFALIVTIFTRGPVIFSRWISAIFSRWIPVSFLLLLLWLCVSGILSTNNLMDTLYLWVMYFYWYSLFLFFYIRSRIYPERLQVFLVLAIFSLLIWVPALIKSTSVIMERSRLPMSYMKQNYIGYYIVALFPYVLLLKRKSLKVIAIALISLGSIYSLKRGAVFSLALMGVSSSFLYIYITNGIANKGRKTIAIILLWGIAVIVGGMFVRANMEAINRRIKTVSGREEIYRRAITMIGNSNSIEYIFGHGDRKAQAAIGVYTHNDWLFLLYDYGIVGIILMLNIYLSLISLLCKMVRMKSYLLLPFVSLIILMTCVQLYSIGLYLKTFGYITGCIGIVVGSFYAERRHGQHIDF